MTPSVRHRPCQSGHLGLALKPGRAQLWGWRSGCPEARVGWLDGHDLFLDIDAAYRAAETMAANDDGIVVGVQILVKRLHEGGWLKSIDERRGKLKVRRMIDGRRLEVLHLPANVLERSLTEKTSPIGPTTRTKNGLPGSHGVGGVGLVNGDP
jgi:hypothetical protein